MKSRNSRVVLALLALATLSGCELRQQMYNNGRIKPMEKSGFFADGRSNRPLVDGTVSRGHLNEDDALFRGQVNDIQVTESPVPVDGKLLARGRQRFDIYCSVCHGQAGYGDGMVVQRGFKLPPSLHEERLRNAPAGHFFDVISNGFGAMPPYREMIKTTDRWAIVAYVRALQLSQRATLADVPAAEQGKLQGAQ